eukprot:GHVP01069560.1.p1 GENE.GHVP01069560.1~~GHVP01069560.1.p1  ORF type:complete len:293 (-),score=52.78 GHVP01069560.1:31-909(-)
MKHPNGGFRGDESQIAQLAATYAVISSLVACRVTAEEFETVVDRCKLHDFLIGLKSDDGSFSIHDKGESDTRCSYLALNSAFLANVLSPELVENTGRFVASCQAYDGGIAGEPGLEGHCGTTYCGVAALEIGHRNGASSLPSLSALKKFLRNRQLVIERGFQGRPGKLVDSCYSFWAGASSYIIQNSDDPPLFDSNRVMDYLFACCEGKNGGFRDKPGKSLDFYHTAYSLAAISMFVEHESPKQLKHQPKIFEIDPVHSLEKYTLKLFLVEQKKMKKVPFCIDGYKADESSL